MKAYILTLMASAMIVTVSSLMLPKGGVKKYAQLVSSVMISLSVIAPFKGVLDIDGMFDFEQFSVSELTSKEAERIYNDNIKKELESMAEEELSKYGRAYVTLNDDLSVSIVEIYTEKIITEEEREEIKKNYNPERLEVIYGE